MRCKFNERGGGGGGPSLSRTQSVASRAEFQKIINLWELVPLVGNETAPGTILRHGKSSLSLSLSYYFPLSPSFSLEEANFLNYFVRVTEVIGANGCLFKHWRLHFYAANRIRVNRAANAANTIPSPLS